mgnify:CR=1 FL=1
MTSDSFFNRLSSISLITSSFSSGNSISFGLINITSGCISIFFNLSFYFSSSGFSFGKRISLIGTVLSFRNCIIGGIKSFLSSIKASSTFCGGSNSLFFCGSNISGSCIILTSEFILSYNRLKSGVNLSNIASIFRYFSINSLYGFNSGILSSGIVNSGLFCSFDIRLNISS